ncbi:hypothetical protein [Streptomyces sedi]|uniref:Uncharacterized protein n=1 Tax=Streptomyces sedi TaxID=555059 RepID=A0A5C4UY95_9ACTN|nr:hypothetical protein [Streptomyces sedi]TNM28488.1 hypothetical protein FH715_18240 [Streptomyces sedi]
MTDQPGWPQGQGPEDTPPHTGTPGPRPMPPAPPRSQRKTLLTHGAVGVVCLLVGVGIGAASGTEDDAGASAEPSLSISAGSEPEVAQTRDADPEPEPEPGFHQLGPAESFSDGVHLAGEDIAPGEYTTEGPDPDGAWPMCYWSRNSDSSGEFEAIIANENLQGPGRVTVNDGEYLEASGGCEWNLA